MAAATVQQKEAVVVILDVGSTMAARQGMAKDLLGTSFADAKQAALLFLHAKVQFCPKDEVGLILLGTKETKKTLASEFGGYDYAHLTTLSPVTMPTLQLTQALSQTQPEGAPSDFMDGIILAADMLRERTQGKKYDRRVLLITDAGGEVKNKDDLATVLQMLQSQAVELDVFGVDFTKLSDEQDKGTPTPTPTLTDAGLSLASHASATLVCTDDEEEEKKEEHSCVTPLKRQNEEVLIFLCQETGGSIVDCQEALRGLQQPRAKAVKQTATFRGVLDIAGGAVQIPLCGYLKTKPATSGVVMQSISRLAFEARGHEDPQAGKVRIDRRYFVESNPDEEVPQEQRLRAYRYGKSYVQGVDPERFKLPAKRGLSLIFFVSRSSVPRKYFLGPTYVFCPPAGDAAAYRACYALLQAMLATSKVALVRYVRCENAEPQVGVLLPCCPQRSLPSELLTGLTTTTTTSTSSSSSSCDGRPDKVFFYFNTLPFIEDLRFITFPSNSCSANPSASCSPEQLAAMEALIHAMDLTASSGSTLPSASTEQGGEEGEELLKPKHVPNPALQYKYHCIRHRALNPSEPLPPSLPPELEAVCFPWKSQGVLRAKLDQCEPYFRAVKEQFPLAAVAVTTDGTAANTTTSRALKRASNWLATPSSSSSNSGVEATLGPTLSDTDAASQQQQQQQQPLSKKRRTEDFLPPDAPGVPSPLPSQATQPLPPPPPPPPAGVLQPVLSKLMTDRPVTTTTTTTTAAKAAPPPAVVITTANPVGDFQRFLSRRDVDIVEEVVRQMCGVIQRLLQESIGDQYYTKALQCLLALRQGCVKEEESEKFNHFLRELKTKLRVGPHAAFWEDYVKARKVSLIHSRESGDSSVTEQEAMEFLFPATSTAAVTAAAPAAVAVPGAEGEEEDWFKGLEA